MHEDQMKKLKGKCVEHEHKNSSNNFIEHYLKSIPLEEMKESFKIMSRHRSKPIS